jgi:hypothetical protein
MYATLRMKNSSMDTYTALVVTTINKPDRTMMTSFSYIKCCEENPAEPAGFF